MKLKVKKSKSDQDLPNLDTYNPLVILLIEFILGDFQTPVSYMYKN